MGESEHSNDVIKIVELLIDMNIFIWIFLFLITAFSPELMDADYLARAKLDQITPRGVQLATLFMEGVEMALLANDACGAPVPFLMCCPWLFFDGDWNALCNPTMLTVFLC